MNAFREWKRARAKLKDARHVDGEGGSQERDEAMSRIVKVVEASAHQTLAAHKIALAGQSRRKFSWSTLRATKYMRMRSHSSARFLDSSGQLHAVPGPSRSDGSASFLDDHDDRPLDQADRVHVQPAKVAPA